jgi:hypothetical protein
MPTISLIAINNGDAADATPVQANFAELQSVGNALDSANWATGKIFAPSKITQEGATTDQAMVWNGTTWIAGAFKPTKLAQDGATTGEVLKWTGSAWDHVVLAELLGTVEYNPTTITSASTTSTTGADVDATNLSLLVTVPGSGKILVSQSASIAGGSGKSQTFWGLRESTNDISYRKMTTDTSTPRTRETILYLVTGLSAGAHTYKWAFKAITAGTATCDYGTEASPTAAAPGPAVMSIWAVN